MIICMEWGEWCSDRRIRSWILDLKNARFWQLSVFIRRQTPFGRVPFWKGSPLQLGKHTLSENTVWVGHSKPHFFKKNCCLPTSSVSSDYLSYWGVVLMLSSLCFPVNSMWQALLDKCFLCRESNCPWTLISCGILGTLGQTWPLT